MRGHLKRLTALEKRPRNLRRKGDVESLTDAELQEIIGIRNPTDAQLAEIFRVFEEEAKPEHPDSPPATSDSASADELKQLILGSPDLEAE
jgi:hypothetical protein